MADGQKTGQNDSPAPLGLITRKTSGRRPAEPANAPPGKITLEDLVLLATNNARQIFEDLDNGIFALAAYAQARKLAPTNPRLIPIWVFEYLDQAVAKVLARDGTSSPETIALAFRLLTTGGGPAAGTRARNDMRTQYIRTKVHWWQSKGRSLDDAIFNLADETGLSDSRIREIVGHRAPRKRRKRTKSKRTTSE